MTDENNMQLFVDNCPPEGKMKLCAFNWKEKLDEILTAITKHRSSTCKIDCRNCALGIPRDYFIVESSSRNIQLKLLQTEALNNSFMIAPGNWRASIISATWQIPQRPEGVPWTEPSIYKLRGSDFLVRINNHRYAVCGKYVEGTLTPLTASDRLGMSLAVE